MQIISGTYFAEFGRAAGGIINVISRSASNDLHGSGKGLYRPLETSARCPLAACRNGSFRTTISSEISIISCGLIPGSNRKYRSER